MMLVPPPPPPIALSMAPPPPRELPRGFKHKIGRLVSTVLADIDFETSSYAGYLWNPETSKFAKPPGATKKGLPAVGSAAYLDHPTTRVICAAFNLKNGNGAVRWKPSDRACTVVNKKTDSYDVYIGRPSEWGNPFEIGKDGTRAEVIELYEAWLYTQPQLMRKVRTLRGKRLGCFCSPEACHGDVLSKVAALPWELFDYLATFDPDAPPSYDQTGIIEAHNSMFEVRVILRVLSERYGWPKVHLNQFRCSASKARAHGLPGKLSELGAALKLDHGKNKDGMRLIKIFSNPRDPTKANKSTMTLPEDDPVNAALFYDYNEDDIVTESEASAKVPDLPIHELMYWLADQAINFRGVECDSAAVQNCICILEQALNKYNEELEIITGGLVKKASELQRLKDWLLKEHNVYAHSMDEEALDELLGRKTLPDEARRALEIRQLIGSASVKKVYAMARQVTRSGRLCDMAIYHGARTGRDNGDGVQPLNMPKAGPRLKWCVNTRKPYGASLSGCPHCGLYACHFLPEKFAWDKQLKETSWDASAVDHVLEVIATRSLETVEYFFGDALLCISGCARGLFIAKEGYELIGVDYSSIEAVTAAMLAGELWRIEAFKAGRDIYLESASRITGKSYEWYLANGFKKHPDRQYIGKPAELGLGYGGWLNGWRQFDDSDNFTDWEVKQNIIAWREASPRIVEMWGGQVRGKPWAPTSYELFGLEGMAILAIQNPGHEYTYNRITYYVECDRLYCRLPSGRLLTYHEPRLSVSDRFEGQLQISFMGWNSNPKKGPLGWVRMNTHGAQLFENVDQAVSRDIMAHAVINLEKTKRYFVVLRVHDEIVCEVEIGKGSIAEQVTIMVDLPDWCKDWPIRAAGWETPMKRYQKD